MRAARLFRSIARVTYKDLLGTITRPRYFLATALVGIAILSLAWGLAQSAVNAADVEPEPGEEPEGPPVLWHRGPEGAYVTLAFGAFPALLPIISIVVVYDSIALDRRSRFFEMVMSRPVPRWSHGLAKCLGIFAAAAIPALALVVGGAVIIQITLGSAIPSGLLMGVIGATLFMMVLYVGLGLLLSSLVSPGATGSLLLILWMVFNGASPTGLIVTAQFLLVVPLGAPHLYQATFADIASVTGLFQGLTSVFVAESLQFVVVPSILVDLVARLAYHSVIFSSLPWLIAVPMVFLYLYNRLEVV